MAGVIINNIIKEENIEKQRAPLDSNIFAKTQQSAENSNNLNSDHSLFANIVTLVQYIGPQVSKYTQMPNQRPIITPTLLAARL
jgi:hypothetical protein